MIKGLTILFTKEKALTVAKSFIMMREQIRFVRVMHEKDIRCGVLANLCNIVISNIHEDDDTFNETIAKCVSESAHNHIKSGIGCIMSLIGATVMIEDDETMLLAFELFQCYFKEYTGNMLEVEN